MRRESPPEAGASVRIRDVTDADLAAVLAINERSIPAMNSLTHERLRWFVRQAVYFRVAVAGQEIAGFLICLAPDAPYGSANFRWFSQRYDDFLYVDRVAVSASYRRRGVADALYRDAAASVGRPYRLLAAEVNLRPPNDGSLRFHERLGFEPVGAQDHGRVKVRYLVRPLPL